MGSRIAALLRKKDMDISVAHVIETVRLAQTTAALRGLPAPTLEEYNEAVTTVMGFGDDMLLQLIRESLIVGNRLGKVPEAVPKVPLLIDVERLQKRLRVPFTAEIKEMTLDLRKETDLERSLFFHRLVLLDIDWAKPESASGKGYIQGEMEPIPQAGTDCLHHRTGGLGQYGGGSRAEVRLRPHDRNHQNSRTNGTS